MSNSKTLKNVNVYCDGFNFYHAIDALKKNHLKWINYIKMAESFLRHDEHLHKTYLFTSLTTLSSEKRVRNQCFLDAQRAVGTELVMATFKTAKKYCRKEGKYCKFKEEKGNDINIALQMVADANDGAAHRMVLVTADTDQIPTVEYIRTRFPDIEISLFIPPGRRNEARDLGRLFVNPVEISEGRIEACLLPHEIKAANGKTIIIPPEYIKVPH